MLNLQSVNSAYYLFSYLLIFCNDQKKVLYSIKAIDIYICILMSGSNMYVTNRF